MSSRRFLPFQTASQFEPAFDAIVFFPLILATLQWVGHSLQKADATQQINTFKRISSVTVKNNNTYPSLRIEWTISSKDKAIIYGISGVYSAVFFFFFFYCLEKLFELIRGFLKEQGILCEWGSGSGDTKCRYSPTKARFLDPKTDSAVISLSPTFPLFLSLSLSLPACLPVCLSPLCLFVCLSVSVPLI